MVGSSCGGWVTCYRGSLVGVARSLAIVVVLWVFRVVGSSVWLGFRVVVAGSNVGL